MIQNDYSWSGILEPLFNDEEVTKIMINKPNEIWVERNRQLYFSNLSFRSEEDLDNFVTNTLHTLGHERKNDQYIYDIGSPFKTRFHFILPPVSEFPTITIQMFRVEKLTLKELIRNGTINDQQVTFLKSAIKNNRNIVISGGTGSGKTTFLNALIPFFSDDKLFVSLENGREFEFNKTHIVHHNIFDLSAKDFGFLLNFIYSRPLKHTFFIGDVRNEAAFELITNMCRTLKQTSFTIHSPNAKMVTDRMFNLALQNHLGIMNEEEFKIMMGEALDVIVHLNRSTSGQRTVLEIVEVSHYDTTNKSFVFKTIF